MRSFDAVVLLGISGFYAQIWSHRVSIERKPRYELDVADLECLQILLTSSRDNPHGATPTPDDLPEMWAETRLQYFAEINHERLEALGAERAQLATRVRSHAAYYRNPYGRKFFAHMLTTIAALLDSNVPARQTHRFSSFASVLLRMIEAINERLVIAQEQIRSIHEPGTDLRSFSEALAHTTQQAKDLYAAWFAPDLPREALQYLCYNMIERSSWLIFRFTADEIARFNPDPGYDPIPDLKLCAIGFSDTKSAKVTDPWYRPFVFHEDTFYLFSPYTALSFPFHLLTSIGSADSSAFKSRLENVRGKFLEQEAAAIFKRHFPASTVIPKAYWYEESGNRIETDLIVIVGDRLLVIESKGAILPDKLIAGRYDRAKTFLRDTFGSGNLQTIRLMHRLGSCSHLQLYDERGDRTHLLESCSFTEIIPIVLTVEELGIIANARSLLELAKISDAELFEAMPIMVAELDYVLSLLTDQVIRLHYLSRRSKIFRQRAVIGDELDLFALYVMFGFSADVFKKGELIWALGASYSLKNYINTNEMLEFPDTSTVKSTAYFSRVLSLIAESKAPDYLNACFLILDTPPGIQESFEREARKTRLETIDGRRRKSHFSFRIATGIASHVLVGTLCRAISGSEKGIYLKETVENAIREAKVNEGLLVDLPVRTTQGPILSFISQTSD
jgi:hypothetical protein